MAQIYRIYGNFEGTVVELGNTVVSGSTANTLMTPYGGSLPYLNLDATAKLAIGKATPTANLDIVGNKLLVSSTELQLGVSIAQSLTNSVLANYVALEAGESVTVCTGIGGYGFIFGYTLVGVVMGCEVLWEDDGTPLLLYASPSIVDTDTDGYLCVIKSGTSLVIKNRRGSKVYVKYRMNMGDTPYSPVVPYVLFSASYNVPIGYIEDFEETPTIKSFNGWFNDYIGSPAVGSSDDPPGTWDSCEFAVATGGTTTYENFEDYNGCWVQKAASSGSSQTYALTVFNNKLYAGGVDGCLYEWNGTDAWVQVAPQLNSQTTIYSMGVFNNKLYGGTQPSGMLFEWNGSNAWVQVAPQLNSQGYISSLCEFNGKLYGGTRTGGRLFEWNGSNAWVQVAPQYGSSNFILALGVYSGVLYGHDGGTTGQLLAWNGSNAWTLAATTGVSGGDLVPFNSKLYIGAVGGLFEWNGTTVTNVGPSTLYYMGVAILDNKVYCSASGVGSLFLWNGVSSSTLGRVLRVANTLNGILDLRGFATLNGKIYASGSEGRLFEWSPGSGIIL